CACRLGACLPCPFTAIRRPAPFDPGAISLVGPARRSRIRPIFLRVDMPGPFTIIASMLYSPLAIGEVLAGDISRVFSRGMTCGPRTSSSALSAWRWKAPAARTAVRSATGEGPAEYESPRQSRRTNDPKTEPREPRWEID